MKIRMTRDLAAFIGSVWNDRVGPTALRAMLPISCTRCNLRSFYLLYMDFL